MSIKDRLFEALKKSTADYCEVRYETEEGAGMSFRGKEVESAGMASVAGGIVRACTKGGWGVVKFDSLDTLEHQVKEACVCAALVGREKTILADVPPVNVEKRAVLKNDFRGASYDEKLKVIEKYNSIILNTPSIESTGVSYRERFRTVYFASTRGNYFMEERPMVSCSYHAIARAGSLVQQSFDSVSSTNDYRVVFGQEEKAKVVADRAAALLKAPPCEGGTYTVILDQQLAGVFIHEAFGHLSEGDCIYENPQMIEMMKLGKEIAPKNFNVIDDGSIPNQTGTQFVDDEGTPTRKNYLIKNGVLAGHLHSLETAGKMGEQPTGNARAVRRGFPPIVRMTNTYVDNGTTPVEELFAGVDRGIYACEAFGGQTMLEMFTFSAGYGYKIENGKKGELIRDVMLSGNVFGTLKSIDGIGNDLRMPQKGGGCGKGGQSPLPVGDYSPHLRIQNVVVGGI